MTPRILVFAASNRADSYNRKLALAAAAALAGSGAEVTFADLRDYPMPLYDGDLETAEGMPQNAKAFKELVRRHDALVIASPEYNGSFSALLKNTVDWVSRPEPGEPPLAAFRGKTAALLSASPGPGGGQRGLRHLRELLEMIGVKVLPAQVAIPRATAAFDAEGKLARAEDAAALERLVADLAPRAIAA
ncbi:MAG TPA: NAD(P)H-dependent oxidoreductase [Bryobacteraceae bacterium]|nr:NAD(P)H-dependent oxidoreductase [Bryobacteraceae bacterium]